MSPYNDQCTALRGLQPALHGPILAPSCLPERHTSRPDGYWLRALDTPQLLWRHIVTGCLVWTPAILCSTRQLFNPKISYVRGSETTCATFEKQPV
jgi:hypothetical protein